MMSIRQRSLMMTVCVYFVQIMLLQHFNPAEAQSIKDILDSYDAQFLSNFNVNLIVSCKSNVGVDQDPSTFTLQITGNDGKYALVQNRTLLGASRYSKKANPLDYDSAGNYIVTNMKMRTIAFDGASWKIRSEYDNCVLKETGEASLLTDALAARLELYPVNHHDPENLFFRYLLSLGRGYSQLLDTITSSTVDSGGIATVVGPGSLFSSDKGMWRMEIDTKHDYLVRSASFTLSGHEKPLFTCKSQNYWNAELPMYANGDLEFPIRSYKMTTRITKYITTHDQTLFDASINSVTNYPSDTSIMDFSRIDADGMPFVVVPLPSDISQGIVK